MKPFNLAEGQPSGYICKLFARAIPNLLGLGRFIQSDLDFFVLVVLAPSDARFLLLLLVSKAAAAALGFGLGL